MKPNDENPQIPIQPHQCNPELNKPTTWRTGFWGLLAVTYPDQVPLKEHSNYSEAFLLLIPERTLEM